MQSNVFISSNLYCVKANLPVTFPFSSQTQALVERQSAFYSLQRKHKSCRQQLETKELQLALLQRKVATVDQRLGEMTLKESEWDSTIDKVSWFCGSLSNIGNTYKWVQSLKIILEILDCLRSLIE